MAQFPGVLRNGRLANKRGSVKRALAGDMNQGRKNPWHYLDAAGLAADADIGDGATDARAAIAAADTDGPVELPPGTYLIGSNLTLTNNVHPMPGAKLKPASSEVTVTLSGGYTAHDLQHVFDISAGGSFSIPTRTFPYLTPQHFGAVSYLGDNMAGAVDSQPAFQAACDILASQFDSTVMRDAGVLKVPAGAYGLGSSVVIKSGVTIEGAGAQTELHKLSSWSGDPICFAMVGGTNNLCVEAHISRIHFRGDFTAIKDTVSANPAYGCRVGASIFRELTFDCTDGILLTNYTQSCKFEDLFAHGSFTPVNRLLDVRGNFNKFSRIIQEGNTTNDSDPSMAIRAWSYTDGGGTLTGNSAVITLDNILLEGGGGSNKVPLVFDGVGRISCKSLHVEVAAANTYAVEVLNSDDVSFEGGIYLGGYKFHIQDSRYVFIDRCDISGEGHETLESFMDKDEASGLHINTLLTPYNIDIFRASEYNTRIDRVVNRLITTYRDPGIAVSRSFISAGGNLLKNARFANDGYGWTVSSSATPTLTYSQSPFGPGKQVAITDLTDTDTVNFYQTFTIDAAQVGIPLTISGWVKAVSGSPTGFASVIALGAGISYYQTPSDSVRIGGGWSLVSLTFVPQEAGSLNVGVSGVYLSELHLGPISLHQGTATQSDPGYFQELQLSGRSVLMSNAAPSTGTWRVGDFVFNSEPSAGEGLGWVCVTAGSPGTWVPVGHVGNAFRLGTDGGVTFYANATGAQPYFNLLTASGGIQFYQSAGITYEDVNSLIIRDRSNSQQWNSFDPQGAGQQICNTATQKLAFWGKTPVVQPSGAEQAAVTLGNADGEISGLTISASYDQTEIQALRDKCEELADDVRALSTLMHAMRTAAVNSGLIKGSS